MIEVIEDLKPIKLFKAMAKNNTTDTDVLDVEVIDSKIPGEQGLALPVLPDANKLFLVDEHAVSKATLTKEKNEALKMLVKGVDDKEGYEAIRLATATFRTTRTSIEKVRQENVKPINAFLKDYKAKCDELGAICQEAEAHLKGQMDIVDKEKERLAEIAELERKAKIQARVQALMNFGARYFEDAYSFEYAPQHNTSTLQINAFSDEEYEAYVKDLGADHAKHEKALADAEAARIAEAARVAKEAEDNKAQAAALNAKRTALRQKEFRLNFGQELPLPNQFFIENATDEEWDSLIESVTESLKPVEGEVVIDRIEEGEITMTVGIPAGNGTTSADHEEELPEYLQGTSSPDPADKDYTNAALMMLHFNGQSYLESPLGKSIMRVFPIAWETAAIQDIHGGSITHRGHFDNQLYFIVYKPQA